MTSSIECQMEDWSQGGHKKQCKLKGAEAYQECVKAMASHSFRDHPGMTLARRAADLAWQFRSDPIVRRQYLTILPVLAGHEEKQGSEGSQRKMVGEIVRALREMEWTREEVQGELAEIYITLLSKLKVLGHTEEALPTLRERGPWLEQVRGID